MKAAQYAIVGAGLMGRLLAFALAQRGASVDLFDRGGATGEHAAARVAASMLAPLAESAITEKNVVRMGLYGLHRWRELIQTINQGIENSSTDPVFFQQDGTLVVWHHLDAPEAERFSAHLESNCRTNPELTLPWHLDSKSLAELEPSLTERFQHGLYLPREGQLDNRQLLDALLKNLEQHAVQLHWNQAVNPSDLENKGYDWVFDCRGLGAKADWQIANPANPLRGVRGEVIRVYAPEVNLKRPTRLIHPRYPIYIAPKQNHLYVIGATEIESEDFSPISIRSSMELLSAAYSVHSGFAEARIIEESTQCRPTLKNNLPEIQIPKPKQMMINGLYRHGFLIAPAMLDLVLELIDHERSLLAERFSVPIQNPNAHLNTHPNQNIKKTVCVS
jgi:glycine oxidase